MELCSASEASYLEREGWKGRERERGREREGERGRERK